MYVVAEFMIDRALHETPTSADDKGDEGRQSERHAGIQNRIKGERVNDTGITVLGIC